MDGCCYGYLPRCMHVAAALLVHLFLLNHLRLDSSVCHLPRHSSFAISTFLLHFSMLAFARFCFLKSTNYYQAGPSSLRAYGLSPPAAPFRVQHFFCGKILPLGPRCHRRVSPSQSRLPNVHPDDNRGQTPDVRQQKQRADGWRRLLNMTKIFQGM